MSRMVGRSCTSAPIALLRPWSNAGVVSAPLYNQDTWKFAGMFTLHDIIHLIQYYYRTSSFEGAAADVEHFRLESLRGQNYTHKFPKYTDESPLRH